MRLHQVPGHWPHDTRLGQSARAPVLRQEPRDLKPLYFPSAWGNTQPVCSLADKEFSLGCCRQGKQGETQLLRRWCSSSPAAHAQPLPREPQGWAGMAPALPRTAGIPSLAGRKGGKFTQTAVVRAQKLTGMDKSGCQVTSMENKPPPEPGRRVQWTLLSWKVPALPSPLSRRLCTLRTPACVQPWEPGSLTQHAGPVQSHQTAGINTRTPHARQHWSS